MNPTSKRPIADLVRRYFETFQTADRKEMESLLGDDFRFTSPFDDHIDKEAYFERCWPHAGTFQFRDDKKIFVEGDECFVLYETEGKPGGTFRNAELFRFKGERIQEIEVFFGFLPNWKEYTMQLNPYLNFDGQCEAAFKFYEQVLGGKIEAMITHGGSPIAGEVPTEWHDRILHARLAVGDQVLMASDSPPERYEKPQGLYVSLNVDEPADAERIFHALAESGNVTMPFEKTFWAAGGFGMLVDRFGIPWMVNCEGAA